MKISFILPENGNKPIGGFKVVFQYANKLVELGNEVSICFLNNLYPEKTSKTHAVVKRGIKRVLKPNSASRRIDWFDLSSDIQICYNVIFPFELPKADVMVATAVQTVNFVMKLKPEKGKNSILFKTMRHGRIHRKKLMRRLRCQ